MHTWTRRSCLREDAVETDRPDQFDPVNPSILFTSLPPTPLFILPVSQLLAASVSILFKDTLTKRRTIMDAYK